MEQLFSRSGLSRFCPSAGLERFAAAPGTGQAAIVSIQPGSAKVRFITVVVTGMDWERSGVRKRSSTGELLRVERQDSRENASCGEMDAASGAAALN